MNYFLARMRFSSVTFFEMSRLVFFAGQLLPGRLADQQG
ncbi:hypothetical protein ACVWXN_006774 [Bradyrhizobium sp. i1.4.4]